MQYAIKDAEGVVMAIFDVNNLAEAVEIKHGLQRHYNKMHGAFEIFTVNKATPKDIRVFGGGGFVDVSR